MNSVDSTLADRALRAAWQDANELATNAEEYDAEAREHKAESIRQSVEAAHSAVTADRYGTGGECGEPVTVEREIPLFGYLTGWLRDILAGLLIVVAVWYLLDLAGEILES